jgi:hypothetical protein
LDIRVSDILVLSFIHFLKVAWTAGERTWVLLIFDYFHIPSLYRWATAAPLHSFIHFVFGHFCFRTLHLASRHFSSFAWSLNSFGGINEVISTFDGWNRYLHMYAACAVLLASLTQPLYSSATIWCCSFCRHQN